MISQNLLKYRDNGKRDDVTARGAVEEGEKDAEILVGITSMHLELFPRNPPRKKNPSTDLIKEIQQQGKKSHQTYRLRQYVQFQLTYTASEEQVLIQTVLHCITYA